MESFETEYNLQDPENQNEFASQNTKTSPFADSPYETHFESAAPVPPTKKKKAKTGTGKRILLTVLVLILLIGSCAGTAIFVSNYHTQQFSLMQAAMNERIDVLQSQIEAAAKKPASNNGEIAKPTGKLTPAQVYEKTHLAVVEISSMATIVANGTENVLTSVGTGFIISEDGYIVSNYHVIEGAKTVSVNTGFGQSYNAEVVGYDAENDFSMLKIDDQGLPYVNIGSSDDIAIGEQVVAIGYPLSSGSTTLTVGYISAKDRIITTDGKTINMLQTDAAINSGNSGGPLLNMQGEVVGITTAKSSGTSNTGVTIEGVGYAIPMDDVLRMITDLQEYGYITGAYLGVWVRDVDSSAQSYGLPAGVFVEEVMEDGAAERAGLKARDIIINLGGYDITNMTELTLALRKMQAGETVSVTVYRDGQEVYLSVTLDEKPQETPTRDPAATEPTEPSEPSEFFPDEEIPSDWNDFWDFFFKYWTE